MHAVFIFISWRLCVGTCMRCAMCTRWFMRVGITHVGECMVPPRAQELKEALPQDSFLPAAMPPVSPPPELPLPLHRAAITDAATASTRCHFGRSTIRVEADEAKWPDPLSWPASNPGVAEGSNSPLGNFTEHPLHYFSNGDCGGGWNPGHCHADLLGAELVLRMLRANRPDIRAVLGAGHNYQMPTDNQAGNVRQLESPNGIDRWPVFAAWHGVAGDGVLTRQALYSEDTAVRAHSFVSYAALSPPSFSSTWWGSQVRRSFRTYGARRINYWTFNLTSLILASQFCRGSRVSPIHLHYKHPH